MVKNEGLFTDELLNEVFGHDPWNADQCIRGVIAIIGDEPPSVVRASFEHVSDWKLVDKGLSGEVVTLEAW